MTTISQAGAVCDKMRALHSARRPAAGQSQAGEFVASRRGLTGRLFKCSPSRGTRISDLLFFVFWRRRRDPQQPQRTIPTVHQSLLAIGCDPCDIRRALETTVELAELFACGHIPQVDGLPLGTSQEAPAVGRERRAARPALVAGELADLGPRL